ISHRARGVRLRLASTLPARLVVRGGARRVSTRIGTRPRTVFVPVRREDGLLRLQLALSADGRTRRSVVEIDR
ncbi:MAG TPA: hypothetical protein VGV67_12820, partial [Solirubrobacteraceae bacterium]|nr:hypothetical protein [Solirubrobacteraceae bacterium]